MTRAGEVTEQVWAVGRELQRGLNAAFAEAGLGGVVACTGYPCSPMLSFAGDEDMGLRTLFMQEMARHRVLIPYLAPSIAHEGEEIALTVRAAAESAKVLRRVLDGEPLERLLVGPAVQPVFRRFNRAGA
jgi:glutamate-1-semialdehyde 2,1-aminomutase